MKRISKTTRLAALLSFGISKMNIMKKCQNAALIVSLLAICGCEKTYDFDKDIASKCQREDSAWYSDYQTDKRLAVLPATGTIWTDLKSRTPSGGMTRERTVKADRENVGKMLSIYYWKVDFKEEQITPLPESLRRETWNYKVAFKVADKKSPLDPKDKQQQVNLAPSGGASETATDNNVDTDPSGTWTSGDKNSVYSRLVVRSSGTFSFQTVDFTGDVKGGYSGTWKMNGKSVRFEWGSGGADSGSCSGRKTGTGSLVFGATTFTR